MQRYRISNEARLDLARIYWHGVREFGEAQADLYYNALIRRFSDIADAPYKYPTVEHIRSGYRRSVCGVDCIYYRISGIEVQIMRVIGRQKL